LTNLDKNRFEHLELPARLVEYFYEVIKATSINQEKEPEGVFLNLQQNEFSVESSLQGISSN